jgi:hypothetical protein
MSKYRDVEEVVADAETGLAIWKSNTDMKTKDLTLAGYEKAKEAFEAAQSRFKELEREFQGVTTERNVLGEELNGMNVRVRATIKGYFGPDSPEYEKAGGTRTSDRRHPGRRSVAEPALAEATNGDGK